MGCLCTAHKQTLLPLLTAIRTQLQAHGPGGNHLQPGDVSGPQLIRGQGRKGPPKRPMRTLRALNFRRPWAHQQEQSKLFSPGPPGGPAWRAGWGRAWRLRELQGRLSLQDLAVSRNRTRDSVDPALWAQPAPKNSGSRAQAPRKQAVQERSGTRASASQSVPALHKASSAHRAPPPSSSPSLTASARPLRPRSASRRPGLEARDWVTGQARTVVGRGGVTGAPSSPFQRRLLGRLSLSPQSLAVAGSQAYVLRHLQYPRAAIDVASVSLGSSAPLACHTLRRHNPPSW